MYIVMRYYEVGSLCSIAKRDTCFVMSIIQEQTSAFSTYVAQVSLKHCAWIFWKQLDVATTNAQGGWEKLYLTR